MSPEQLLALSDDELRAAIRGRAHGLLYAPRRAWDVGVTITPPPASLGTTGDDAFAVVLGPDVRRAYTWREALGERARSGRDAIDGRALADAAFADATAGAWLFARTVIIPVDGRWERLVPGFVIGRGAEAHLRMAGVGRVARQHARFDREGDGWVVEDLRSTNGTWIGNTRVTRARLAHRDVLNVGGHGIEFFATVVAAPRAIDPADDTTWGSLFLDRIELDVLGAELRYEAASGDGFATRRTGTAVWTQQASTLARDTRWLLPTADDATVFFDALVSRERDEIDAPLVGDDCAAFSRGAVVVRAGSLVAKLEVGTATRLDELAAAIAGRATA